MADDIHGAAGSVPDDSELDPFDLSGDFGSADAGVDRIPADEEEVAIIRAASGEVRPVEIPSTFEEDTWRRMVTVANQVWDANGRTPTPESAHRMWPRIPVETYRLAFLEPEFQRALAMRGVELDPSESLSDIQHMAILKLSDPADRRTDRAKLNGIGVSWPRYQGWLKNPVFVDAKRRKVEETFADAQDAALNRLRANVDAGDQRAIEFTLEVTGRYNRQNLAIQDARTVILLVVEAVIKRVEDPEVREAIMADVKAAAHGFDLTNHRALEG